MEKTAPSFTTEPTQDDVVLRPKPDRRAHPRVPAADITREVFLPRDTLLTEARHLHPAKADLRTDQHAKKAS